MFDRFTDRARKVMGLARQEAQRLNHEYIGTEHILLGLVQEGSGVAANVLKNLDIDLSKVRKEVEKMVKTGPSMVTMGQLPFTPRAKKVLEFAMSEARRMGLEYPSCSPFTSSRQSRWASTWTSVTVWPKTSSARRIGIGTPWSPPMVISRAPAAKILRAAVSARR